MKKCNSCQALVPRHYKVCPACSSSNLVTYINISRTKEKERGSCVLDVNKCGIVVHSVARAIYDDIVK
jgi:hypothetical protein